MSKDQKTVDVITIKRSIEQHKDILAVAEHYSAKYGTMAQTLCVLVRESPLYLAWKEQQAAQGKRGKTK